MDFTIRHLIHVALCLAALSGRATAATQVLIIATSELPPYVSANPSHSFLTELLPEVGKVMGVTFRFRFMPWPRCERAVEEQQVWAAMPYVPTPEREAKFLFSQPLYAKRTLLFYYQHDERQYPQTFTRLSELKPYRMGGVRGYYYGALFEAAGLELEQATSEDLSFKKLRAARVDMVPAVEAVGWDVIAKNFSKDEQAGFHTLKTPLTVGHNFLMTSRNYPHAQTLLVRFNEALATVRRNGVYRRVAERHGVVVDN